MTVGGSGQYPNEKLSSKMGFGGPFFAGAPAPAAPELGIYLDGPHTRSLALDDARMRSVLVRAAHGVFC